MNGLLKRQRWLGRNTPSRSVCQAQRAPRKHYLCRATAEVFELSNLISVGGALVAALPASVALDEALDSVQQRVQAITNLDANGTRCFIAYPDAYRAEECRKWPVVLVIHQILGVQPREVDLCRDLASQGYVAIAPDTFQGCATVWPFRAIWLGFNAAFKSGATWGVPDLHNVVTWIQSQPSMDASKLVVSGFCYGGGSAVRYAAAYPDNTAGVVIFYGRPLLEAAEVAQLGSTRVLAMYGTQDRQFPKAMVDKFEADLRASGTPHLVERFEGLGHAFIKDAESIRTAGPAARAWGLFTQFLQETNTKERAD